MGGIYKVNLSYKVYKLMVEATCGSMTGDVISVHYSSGQINECRRGLPPSPFRKLFPRNCHMAHLCCLGSIQNSTCNF